MITSRRGAETQSKDSADVLVDTRGYIYLSDRYADIYLPRYGT